jgi:acetyltransferase
MPDAKIWGVAVQEMVKPGREVILGITHDPQFGHLIMFGLGGIYVEVLKDVSFRVAPLTRTEARQMIREIRSFPLLAGVRGQQPADLEAVTDALMRVSQMVTDFPEIIELDVNPLVVNPVGGGATAVDARIILASGQRGQH